MRVSFAVSLLLCIPHDVVCRLSKSSNARTHEQSLSSRPQRTTSTKPTVNNHDVLSDDHSLDDHSAALQWQHYRNNTSLCERINPNELPPECTCSEPGPYSLVLSCLKTFNSTYLNDTIGMKIVIDPCDPDGASVSIDVTERDHDIDYPISGIRANEEKDYPIPGLAVIVPGLGHVGLDVAVLVAGNMDSLTLKIGLNACVALASRTVCASSLPGISTILPWYVLSGTYKFGDICDERFFFATVPQEDDRPNENSQVVAAVQ